ncbi:MAG TPA: class I SAM-dependent methyltransferase, partial [Ktedonobacterales bacterium]
VVGARGIVIAADIQGEMLSTVKVRAQEQGLTNVRLLKMNDTSVTLPPRSCDFVLVAFVLHEVPQHATFLNRLERILKPTGQLVVIEWQKREETDGPPVGDRLSSDELLADAVAAGLREHDFRELGESQYLYVFTSARAEA